MPIKSASSPRRRPAAARSAAAKKESLEIVVRRGAVRRFDALKTQTTELPVKVTWDRRTATRRGAKAEAATAQRARERRAEDRRQEPPFTWDLADFVVVPPGSKRALSKKKPKNG